MKSLKKCFILSLTSSLLFVSLTINAQNVGINSKGNKPSSDAVLDLRTGNLGSALGFLPNEVALSATNSSSPFSSVDTGLIVYNYTTAGTAPYNVVPGYYYWTGSAWVMMLAPSVGTSGQVLTSNGGGTPSWTTLSTSGTAWQLTGNSGTTVGTDFIGTNDAQPLEFKVDGSIAGYIDYFYILGNVSFGYQALGTNNNFGIQNSAFGYQALYNSLGEANVANGYQALYSNTYGNGNVANGLQTLYYNINGNYNIAEGYKSLYNNSNSFNIASGYLTLYSNTFGNNNIGMGQKALYANVNGSNNLANGYYALTSNVSGNGNMAYGYQTMQQNTTGSTNSAFGFKALQNGTTGNYNLALGDSSLGGANNTGTENVAVGSQTLYNNTAGSSNVGIGYLSETNNTTGNYNTGIGYNAGVSTGGLTNATAIGANAMVSTSNTILLGGNSVTATEFNGALMPYYSSAYNAGTSGQVLESQGSGAAPQWTTLSTSGTAWQLTGNSGTTVGTDFIGTTDAKPLEFKVDGSIAGYIDYSNSIANSSLGYQALNSNTNGKFNSAFGYQALYFNTTGVSNTASGCLALYNNTTGAANVADGTQALINNTTGQQNTAVGDISLSQNTSGNFNSSVGNHALGNNTSGGNNVSIGYEALLSNTTGSNNMALGSLADVAAGNLTNATAIGANAIVSTSNTILLGSNSVTATEFNGALMPYYSSAYNAGTSGQVLESQGSGAAPQWVTPTVNTYIGGTGIKISNDTISNTQSSGAINYVGTSYLGITSGAGSTGTSEGTSSDLVNINIGQNAGNANTTGNNNFFLGNQAGYSNTSGSNNIAIGTQTLLYDDRISNLIAIGTNALANSNYNPYALNTGGDIAIGVNALAGASSNKNTAVGFAAGHYLSITDSNNTLIGYEVQGGTAVDGTNNSGLGYLSLFNNTGGRNSAFGSSSGFSNTTGSNNTFIGYAADASSSGLTNATAIGSNAIVSTSNTILLGSTSVTATEINGALMPYYSSAYNAGTSGQVLESQGSGVAPQWITPSFGTVTGSGTATQVAFWSGSSALSSNSNLYWDNTNDRLGIGTSSPTAALHTVASGAKTAAYSGNLLTNTATSSTASIKKAALELQSTGSWTGTSATNIGLYVSSTTGGTNNYDAIFDGGGNVGIGTTSPTAILHTVASGAKTAAYSGNLLTNTATSSTASIKKAALELQSTGSWNGTSATNISLYVSSTTGGTNNYDAIFNGGGNVGIGTSSPTAALHTIASGAKTAAYSGNLFTNTATSSTSSIKKAGVEIQSTGSWTGTSATNIGLYVSSTTGGTNNYDAIFNGGGYVGIGTASPQAPLEVYSANYLMLDAEGSGTTGTWLRLNNTSTGGTTWNLISTGSGNSEGAGNLLFNANGYTKMTIQSSTGNLGIGTTSPSSPLTVSGSFSGATSYIAAFINTNNPTSGYGQVLLVQGGQVTNTYNSNLIAFENTASTVLGSISQNSSSSIVYNTTSDERLKENIKPTSFGLNDLMKIQIKDYTYKADNGKYPQTGFIAQQLYTVFPNAVHIGGDDPKTNPWMVDYGRITPLLVKSIQDQQQIIDEQNKKLDAQQKQIDELKSMVEQMVNSKK